MYNFNSTFEDVFSEILKITVRPDFLEMEYNLENGIYVGFICLDDHEESDTFDFTWEIGKKVYEQSKETQQTLNIIFNYYNEK